MCNKILKVRNTSVRNWFLAFNILLQFKPVPNLYVIDFVQQNKGNSMRNLILHILSFVFEKVYLLSEKYAN